MSLRSTGELCVMTMKNDAEFEEKSTCQFKIDIRNLTNLTRALRNFRIIHFRDRTLSM